MTGDESWIYAYGSETKQQSTVWVFQDEKNQTKVVRARSTSKQMFTCFFEKPVHVATIPLEQRRTVNSGWKTGSIECKSVLILKANMFEK